MLQRGPETEFWTLAGYGGSGTGVIIIIISCRQPYSLVKLSTQRGGGCAQGSISCMAGLIGCERHLCASWKLIRFP